MFTIDKKQYLNLQEQVLKNKQDIAAHYNVDRVLADFGIKIIGQLTPEQFAEEFLENQTPPPTGNEDYGASYAVGTTDPYDFYIWTRADIDANGTHATPYWLNIGKLAIEGIQGPPGPSGPVGATGASTKWVYARYIANLPPATSANLNLGDLALVSAGDVLVLVEIDGERRWGYTNINIKGPTGDTGPRGYTGEPGAQGPTGPQGAQGARGLGLVILGTDLASIEALPDPATVRRDGAYLMLIDGVKYIYAITGKGISGDPLRWEKLGEYNVTPSLPEGKLYQHNISIHLSPDVWTGGLSIDFLPLYSTSPERVTAENWMNFNWVQLNTNGRMTFYDGQYIVITCIKYEYLGDQWGWAVYGYELNGGNFTKNIFTNPFDTFVDTVYQV